MRVRELTTPLPHCARCVRFCPFLPTCLCRSSAFPLARPPTHVGRLRRPSITPSAYLPQPHGKTAIVSGLNYTSRIFALLGEILVRIRVDKRSPPQGQFLTARLEEVQALHARIVAALAHAPEPLRLKHAHGLGLGLGRDAGHGQGQGRDQTRGQNSIPPEYGGAGFRQAAFTEVKDFFDNPNASRANALNPFLVMQANLYVTQVSRFFPVFLRARLFVCRDWKMLTACCPCLPLPLGPTPNSQLSDCCLPCVLAAFGPTGAFAWPCGSLAIGPLRDRAVPRRADHVAPRERGRAARRGGPGGGRERSAQHPP